MLDLINARKRDDGLTAETAVAGSHTVARAGEPVGSAGKNKKQTSWEARRQTMVFSATLNPPAEAEQASMDELMKKVKFSSKPQLVDLCTRSRTVEQLEEFRVQCLQEDKDAYCYYLLHNRPGRTIVFVNAISMLNRLTSILGHLGVTVQPLHSHMQQRARLKRLDRFKATSNAVLVATDVAGRGLDIKGVEFVVNYQVPRSSDDYVHRAGRTARIHHDGQTVTLISPKELVAFKKILHSLGKQDEIPAYEIDARSFAMAQRRVALALQIDKQVRRWRLAPAHRRAPCST